MPLHLTARRRLKLTKDLIPAFVDSWAEIFQGNEDEQYDALVDEQRAGADERAELFRSLEAAIPPEAHGLLRSIDAAWSRQADAREDAAYLIGAAIGQTRRCSECLSPAHCRTFRRQAITRLCSALLIALHSRLWAWK